MIGRTATPGPPEQVQRWTASATSYVMLLMPLVTVAVAAAVLGQSITPALLAGGALVLGGVWVGALGRRRGPGAMAQSTSPELRSSTQPGCA